MLNANGRHVSHDGEEVEIFGGEFLNEAGRIEIDEAADAVFGLQRHGQHAADLLRHDTFAGGQRLMPQGVANQERTALVQNQVTHAGADPKPGAFGSTDAEFAAVLECHQDSSRSFHRFHRQIEDEFEQCFERHVAHQFAAGANEGLHVTDTLDFLFVAEESVESGGQRGATGRRGRFFNEYDRLGGGGTSGFGEDYRQLPGCDAVIRLEHVRSGEGLSVYQCAVGAAEIAEGPVCSRSFEYQMLAGEATDLGITEVVGEGAA